MQFKSHKFLLLLLDSTALQLHGVSQLLFWTPTERDMNIRPDIVGTCAFYKTQTNKHNRMLELMHVRNLHITASVHENFICWIVQRIALNILFLLLFDCFLFRNAWFAIDLGVWFIPSCYTLRHARGYGRSVSLPCVIPKLLYYTLFKVEHLSKES